MKTEEKWLATRELLDLTDPMASLDSDDRALLRARFVDDKDITEFARARKLAPSTAYSRLYRVLGWILIT